MRFGDHPGDAYLYEDDGDSFDYRDGSYNWIKLSWNGRLEFERNGHYSGVKYRITGCEVR
ncbi:DUF5110 domain-containing protein [Paenibacillus sp. P26]|nr:DUF5110 domain-containing protein [Paenibacillus sp. P26]